MSQEPRLRLIKNGTVVGTIWEDSNGNLVLEDSEGTQSLKVGSAGIDADGGAVINQDVETVTSTGDLNDGEPGFYYISNEDSVLYFDGDTSTN